MGQLNLRGIGKQRVTREREREGEREKVSFRAKGRSICLYSWWLNYVHRSGWGCPGKRARWAAIGEKRGNKRQRER